MLGFFTDPYPDEILYSAIARYHERVRNRGTATTLHDLFGIQGIRVSVDLPCRLRTLTSHLPSNHGYTVDRLIDEHTMLPLYAPFLPSERVARLRESMAGDESQGIFGRLKSSRRGVPVESLRYCSVCFEEDRSRYNEPYWHRVHQVPGIAACPIHAVLLEDSSVALRARSYRDALITARRAVAEPVPARRLDADVHQDQVQLKLARDAGWLLGQKCLTFEDLRKRYTRVLYEKSLASYTGVVHLAGLRRGLKEFYTPRLLESLSCEIKGSPDWVELTVKSPRRAQHVFCHLLLICFLGYSAEEFFGLPETGQEPFGTPPFPCLNPAAGHFRESRIGFCRVGRKIASGGRLKGTFACPDCGFTYRRYGYRGGHDDDAEGRYEFYRILHFGEVWDNALRRYVAGDGLSEEQIGTRLGVSRGVLRNRIAQLGLKGRRSGSQRPLGRPKDSPAAMEAKRSKYRAVWLRALERHPGEGRDAIAARHPTAYSWLRRNDQQWYAAHAPSPRRPKGGKVKYDWERRDVELAVQVRVTIDRIKSLPGRPVRASKTAVMQELSAMVLMAKRREHLPRTLEVLESDAESAEQFAVRRVWWAARCLLEQRVRSPRHLLIRRSVTSRVAHVPAVSSALDEAVEHLARACEQGWE